MTILVVLNCAVLALNNPHSAVNDGIYAYIDLVTEVLFTAELIFKFIAFGVYWESDQAYLRNGWNVIDFVVVICSWVGFNSVRSLRAVRPLRIVGKVEEMRVVIYSFKYAIPAIAPVLVFGTVLLFIMSVFGVSLFMGKFGFCLDSSVPQGAPRSECPDGFWRVHDTNFDNVGRAMLSLFQLATLSDWNEIMYRAIDAVGVDRNAQKNFNEWAGLFFILAVFVLGFFMINLLVGALIGAFNKHKKVLEDKGKFLMTEYQAILMQALHVIRHKKLLPFRAPAPSHRIRRFFFKLCGDGLDMTHPFEMCITIILLINMLTVCMQHHGQPSEFVDAEFYVGLIATGVFAFETVVKIIAWDIWYFRSWWNVFDFILALASSVSVFVSSGPTVVFNILRLFRLLRMFRFIKKFKKLQAMFETLSISALASFNVATVMFVVFFIFAIFGMQFFGK
eukprot:jgi/Bigna1/41275/e_gw1.51.112.1